jgi:hypothetical protein
MALDWSRQDTLSATNSYYGYSINQSAADSDNTWFIKKVTTSASVSNVTWTNGDPNIQISTWTNRANSFIAPTASLGLTWSSSTSYVISFSWSLISGVDMYKIYITGNNVKLTPTGQFYYGEAPTAFLANKNSFIYPGSRGVTYSVTLVASNVAGSVQSSSTIYIP